jgi:transposase InsO family protein
MRTELVQDALQMAAAIRGVGEDSVLIHHSDRGSLPELNRSSQQCRSGTLPVGPDDRDRAGVLLVGESPLGESSAPAPRSPEPVGRRV